MIDVEIMELLMASDGYAFSGDLLKYERNHIKKISFDSRDVDENTLFIPIIGEKVDAHRFIPDVFAKGCRISLTSRKDIDYHGDKILVWVPDTLEAMQKMAEHFRSKITVPVVGITGSVGKTSTRQMVDAALSAGLKTYVTKGNNNSQIGVPNTIFNYDDQAEIAVMEMGMSIPGEMSRLSGIVRPDTSIITNIGIAHIENLGSRENIFKEKIHITDHMKPGRYVLLNHENDILAKSSLRSDLKKYYFGFTPDCDAYAENLVFKDGFPSFSAVISGEHVDVELGVQGQHYVLNALAALACAKLYGVNLKDAARKLAEFRGFSHRQQIIRNNNYTIIDDTYNASPDSMRAGITVLSEMKCSGRRIAVLADMMELGEESDCAHENVADFIRQSGNIDVLMTLGKYWKKAAKKSYVHERYHFDNIDGLNDFIREFPKQGDIVFIKGSNSMKLSLTVDTLTSSGKNDA